MRTTPRWMFLAALVSGSASLSARRAPDQLRGPTVQFVVEFARWKRLQQIVIFDPFTRAGEITYSMLKLTQCLAKQGVYTTVHSPNATAFKTIFRVDNHKLGVVFMLNDTYEYLDIVRKAVLAKYFGEYHIWLMIAPNIHDSIISGTLFSLPLSLNTHLVVATATRPLHVNDDDDLEECTAFGSIRRGEEPAEPPTADENRWYYKKGNLQYAHFYLLQVYKIRKSDNISTIVHPLGFWGTSTGFTKATDMKDTEDRKNMFGHPLIIGVRRWFPDSDPDNVRDRKTQLEQLNTDRTYLAEILYFLTVSINASVQFVNFTNLGTKNQDGSWNNMLGAAVAGAIDMGVEKVEVSPDKLAQMSFSYTIMKSRRNMFIHQSELSTTRDIYLTSFSPRLLLCVLGTSMAVSLLMVLINNLHYFKLKDDQSPSGPVDAAEAAVWSIGMLSMQGTTWLPKCVSGMVLTVTSLLFAVVIYNSYSAFITSVLSIKQGNIKSLSDIFANGYEVGYVTGSPDEEFLQAQTNELAMIYMKGHTFRVESIEEGLLKAAQYKFALFAAASRARQALSVLSPYDCRCKVEEFTLPKTTEKNAFPMTKQTPYRKIINLNVLKLRENGIMNKMQQLMYPSMPKCSTASQFFSAQLSDVATAFKLLALGYVVCFLVLAVEFCCSHCPHYKNTHKKGRVPAKIAKQFKARPNK